MSQSADCPGNFPIELIFLYFRLRFGAPFFIFGPNWSQYSSERAVSHSPRTSGSLGNFVDFPPDELYCIRRVDAKEDVQDFGQLRPCLDAFQAIVFLLRSERAFHPRCPHPRQLVADDVVLFLFQGRTATLVVFHSVCLE